MKQIKLTQGQVALVDDSDYEWLNQWKWCAVWYKNTKSFRAVVRGTIDKTHYTMHMHRFILGLEKGDKRQGDHINHNTLDNQRHNLRIVTNQENNWNLKDIKGYWWHKKLKKWRAGITINNKQIHLGLFNTEQEAREAYLKAKEKYHIIGNKRND